MPFRIFGIKIPFKRKFSKHRKRKNYLYIKGVSLEYIYICFGHEHNIIFHVDHYISTQKQIQFMGRRVAHNTYVQNVGVVSATMKKSNPFGLMENRLENVEYQRYMDPRHLSHWSQWFQSLSSLKVRFSFRRVHTCKQIRNFYFFIILNYFNMWC